MRVFVARGFPTLRDGVCLFIHTDSFCAFSFYFLLFRLNFAFNFPTTNNGSSFRPKETIFELLGGGGTEAKGDMEQVMGAVRKRARVHRLLTRNETTATDAETAAAEAAAAAAAAVAAGTSLSGEEGEHGDGGDAVEPMDVEGGGGDRVEAAAAIAGSSSTTSAAGTNATAATTASAGGDGRGRGERNRGGGSTAAVSAVAGVKRKLSRFERKRLKKCKDAGGDAGSSGGGDSGSRRGGGDSLAGLEDEVEKEDAAAAAAGGGDGGVMGNGGPGKFADKSFYIGYGTT